MKPAIIGAGSWGAALSMVAAEACGNALLLARDPDKARQIQVSGETPRLPGVKLPSAIHVTANVELLTNADCLIIATPAQNLRETMAYLQPYTQHNIPALIASKGIEQKTQAFMSEVLQEVAPNLTPYCLSGPSFATDVARGLPTAVTLAGKSMEKTLELAATLSTRNFRIYANDDLRGVELGGAVKNVLAIACGICEGLALGDSARAALFTRGFSELLRVGAALDARKETLLGLSGLGDLLLTASSKLSRNFSLGIRLAQGKNSIDPHNGVTEGMWTAPVITALAHKQRIEMPVAEAVCRIIDSSSLPEDEVERLLTRPIKSEF